MEIFDFGRIMLNDNPATFLIEVFFRSLITFVLVFLFLRFIGRRGVKQMTPLEVVIILVLSTAASDVALQEDAPLVPALISFIVIVAVYRGLTLCIRKSEKLQEILEGEPILVVKEGRIVWDNVKKSSIPFDEFSMELRQQSVEHLGQVRLAFLEIDGNASIFYYKDEDVKPGLSLVRQYIHHSDAQSSADEQRYYSCYCCGNTVFSLRRQLKTCTICSACRWSESLDSRRIS